MQVYTKQQAFDIIQRLVDAFQRNEASLQNKAEAQIEQNYIRPLFRALNWNTENEGLAPADWEFVLQDTDRKGKRPDYRLQLEGQHLLLMNAKMVKYNMHDPRWLWQVYKYAYSTRNNPARSKVDFGILTDFQEFVLLDCTFEAKSPEAVSNFRVLDWGYQDYVTKFDRLWELFERNNMLEASRDRKTGLWSCYLNPKQAKANRVSPDEGFLDKLDNEKTGWRVHLAKDMKKCNPSLTGEVITGAVQLLIDRLIFIKALSDRDIDIGYIAKLGECIEKDGLENKSWFKAAGPIFDRLNQLYNGSIFAVRSELEAVETSNRLVREIITELDPEHSPYDLSVLPVEILGTVYERFLGKVVRTTEQRVKIEDKPEVRKAGGVYYTPQYIVRYIVEQTVGKLLAECKTPEDVSKLKILDPACGSGSFLLGAYDALVNWHKTYYGQLSRLPRNCAYRDIAGDVRLTARIKREILLNNLFGVDIDPQAVEVSRFSLSLKALEDTRKEELDEERSLFKASVLPNLKDNIVCGNSLIGTDILDGHMFEPEEELKLNPMNYEDRFPEIMLRKGGFDAIIGNPPYRMLQPHNTDVSMLQYLRSQYVAADFKVDFFHLFLQRSIRLLESAGRLGFIVPATLLNNVYVAKLRAWIDQKCCIETLAVAAGRVFEDADILPVVLTLRRSDNEAKLRDNVVLTTSALSEKFVASPDFGRTAQQRFRELPGQVWNILLNETVAPLVDKIAHDSRPMSSVAKINRGLVTGQRSEYFSLSQKTSKYAPIITGADVQRYAVSQPSEYVCFERPAKAGGCWDPVVHFAPHKLVFRQIGVRPTGALLDCPTAVTANVFTVMAGTVDDEKLLLAVLNSSVIAFYWGVMFCDFKSSFPQITIFSLSQIPVRTFDAPDIRARMIVLVDQMLRATRAKAEAQTEKDKTYYSAKCNALDKQIDALVYELYGLTEEEVALVEASEAK